MGGGDVSGGWGQIRGGGHIIGVGVTSFCGGTHVWGGVASVWGDKSGGGG